MPAWLEISMKARCGKYGPRAGGRGTDSRQASESALRITEPVEPPALHCTHSAPCANRSDSEPRAASTDLEIAWISC